MVFFISLTSGTIIFSSQKVFFYSRKLYLVIIGPDSHEKLTKKLNSIKLDTGITHYHIHPI